MYVEPIARPMSIRMAEPADVPAMLAIYAEYIDTTITFETEVPTEQDFRGRLEGILNEHPWIVWEEDGRVCAYAYAHRLKERAAYAWSTELSVYVDRGCRGSGIGRRLYEALIAILGMQGVVRVFACVTIPNGPSESFHRAMGFRTVGRFEKAGYKSGEWHDVEWLEKEIRECDGCPGEMVLLPDMDMSEMESVLKRF